MPAHDLSRLLVNWKEGFHVIASKKLNTYARLESGSSEKRQSDLQSIIVLS